MDQTFARHPRALVTGAAGFIGCHLAERLAADGWTVVGLDNERSGSWDRLRTALERRHADLAALPEEELDELCSGVDVVFHLAAEKYNSSATTPQRVIDVNVSATQRLFAAAGRAGAKVVFTSSLYAYGSLGPAPMCETDLPAPTTTYGVSKVAGEHLLRVAQRDLDLRWTVARLFFVYGPRQYADGGYKSVIVKNFERLRDGLPPVVFGDGLQALDYVYVGDCVDALVAMAAREHDAEVLNVSTGRAVTVNELTAAMLEVAGADVPVEWGPADWTAGTIRVGSPSLAAERLGWRPATTLEEGLERTWGYYACVT